MPTCNYFSIPWDEANPSKSDPQYGGIVVDTVPFLGGGTPYDLGSDYYGNVGFRIPLITAEALIGRVRTWRLAGTFHMKATGGTTDFGDVTLSEDLTAAIRSSGSLGVMPDEGYLAQHSGWADALSATKIFGQGWFPPGYVDEIGGVTAYKGVTYQPLVGVLGGGESSMSGAQSADDACIVTATFPALYGCTGFSFQLGSTDPDVSITGALTFTPVLWWEHDPGDGRGPKYDAVTGAALR